MTKFCLRIDKSLDLDATLDCGQTFRWTARDGWWTGIVRNTVVRLKKERNELRVKASSDKLLGKDIDLGLISYFGLEDNLEEIHIDIEKKLASMNSKVSIISKKALEEARGLRILRQDPFEMLVEFILSTRNNIPTIRKMSDGLSAIFAENMVEFEGETFFLFPNLEQARHIEQQRLEELKIAFRVPWLLKLFTLESESYFDSIRHLPLNIKLDELMKFDGVGYKVGSCVTLFAYGELNSFPVDIWISRVMKDLFEVSGSTKKVMEYGMKTFYPYAGYYQEALFRYYRKKGRKE
ncbi:MAG TPA: DNA glycosylase [Mesotoga infera]|uniref:DNA-(apurinic or apyrimidinic site) lyase n=1 Tax=Mesotoga infera TaxID=1236046 RepID=A0A7Z7PPL6_9BACT|nr:DNA glycosylase [Mesotoga infera]NLI07251.1 8-oxoguanine DNA glycosylase [Thermotogaceae bacterium]SSC13552.1 3-methyladenine DNA glycosylase/8-oxoguanine DNA glycosylase [Mesotoga infera]HNR79204.1 DNA glycosylase [Mesotoga infera]HNS66123.1 DNA glycosylase [Mesotoga infera]HOI34189.1 DNA glycosylase [Mesotoga infera]